MVRLDKQNITLDRVIQEFRKYLYIPDTKMIEVILATTLSNRLSGTPIWLYIIGSSSCGKSTGIDSISKEIEVIKLDQLTPNTLASGRPDADDLGQILQHSSHILVILDMASITSKHKEDRREIFAQFRTLFDGSIRKSTGSGVLLKEYEGIHVTLIAGSTNILKREYLLALQLGSRELSFDVITDDDTRKQITSKSYDNIGNEEEMKNNLRDIVHEFLKQTDIDETEPTDEIKQYLIEKATRLSILRAVPDYDLYHNDLVALPDIEVPARLVKQFKKLWLCLKSLDANYTDERAKEIIEHIVSSSGDANRQMILNIFENNKDDKYTTRDIQTITKLGRKVCMRQLETLWSLDMLSKETRPMPIAYLKMRSDTANKVVEDYKGKIEYVAFFKWKSVLP